MLDKLDQLLDWYSEQLRQLREKIDNCTIEARLSEETSKRQKEVDHMYEDLLETRLEVLGIPKRSVTLCKYYETGQCLRGFDCPYRHDFENSDFELESFEH